MFGRRQQEINDLRDKVVSLQSSAVKIRRDYNELAARVASLEAQQNKVRVKLVDEDGEPIMKKHPNPRVMAVVNRQDSTYVAIEDVLGSVFEHIGLDFSIERRDQDVIRIEDEVIDIVITQEDVPEDS